MFPECGTTRVVVEGGNPGVPEIGTVGRAHESTPTRDPTPVLILSGTEVSRVRHLPYSGLGWVKDVKCKHSCRPHEDPIRKVRWHCLVISVPSYICRLYITNVETSDP